MDNLQGRGRRPPYQDLPFSHDPVCSLPIFLVQTALAVALLIAKQPQCLRSFQFDLELLKAKDETPTVRLSKAKKTEVW